MGQGPGLSREAQAEERLAIKAREADLEPNLPDRGPSRRESLGHGHRVASADRGVEPLDRCRPVPDAA
jgi:hypothetical protein